MKVLKVTEEAIISYSESAVTCRYIKCLPLMCGCLHGCWDLSYIYIADTTSGLLTKSPALTDESCKLDARSCQLNLRDTNGRI